MLSPMDIGVILLVALVVFGPRKLPEIGKSIGDGISSFKKAMDPQPSLPEHEPAAKDS